MAVVGEIDDRQRAFVANVAGGVTASVAAVLAAALPAVWPLVLPALAGGAVQAAVERLWRGRAARAARFVKRSEQVAGRPLDELLERSSYNDDVLALFSAAAAAAVEARDAWVVDRAAELFTGAVDDPATVDERGVILDVIRQLEPMHVRLLRYLVRDPAAFRDMGTAFEPRAGFSWRRDELAHVDPGLAPVLDALIGRLQMLGVVVSVESYAYVSLTEFGRRCTAGLVEHAEGRWH